jgi:hypothetical protein
VHALLDHLEAFGFDGAPRHLGTDDQGRSVLSFIEGDVGVPPYPGWAADDDVLVSVAGLQRRLHHAVRSFAPPSGAMWDTANLPPPGPGAIVCHNDLCVENVVVRDGRAVAFIDFDFAAPSDPLLDIAIALRHWVPLRDAVDIEPDWAGVDQVARFGLFTGAHGLDRDGRARVVEHGLAFLDRALVSMGRRAEEGRPGYVEVWASGYPGQNRRSHAWLAAHADRLVG